MQPLIILTALFFTYYLATLLCGWKVRRKYIFSRTVKKPSHRQQLVILVKTYGGLILLSSLLFTSCTRYYCQPSKNSKDYAQVIETKPTLYGFKTVLRWDLTGKYDTLHLAKRYAVGQCFQRCANNSLSKL